MQRGIYLALAAVFFGLAALGAFLPGLPATPFLLLTSFFLVRSSPRLHRRLLASRRFGPILENWERHRAVSRRVRRTAVLAAAATVAATLVFGNFHPAFKTLLVLAGILGIWVVLRLRVIEDR